MAIPVKLPVFEGPLDLLMHLIEKNKIDIYDIPIALITAQYLEYVRQMDHEDMDVTSEFLVMAATLLDIKSRMLLPREKNEETGEEEGDPREELVQRLLEYKMYKYLSEELSVRREQTGVRYFREQHLPKEVLTYQPPIDYAELLKNADLKSLQKVFGEVLRRKKSRRDPVRSGFGKIRREEVNIDTKTLYIRAFLQAHPRTDFRALLESQKSKEELIVTFLILLELMRTQKVRIVQDSIGGAMLVELVETVRQSGFPDTSENGDVPGEPEPAPSDPLADVPADTATEDPTDISEGTPAEAPADTATEDPADISEGTHAETPSGAVIIDAGTPAAAYRNTTDSLKNRPAANIALSALRRVEVVSPLGMDPNPEEQTALPGLPFLRTTPDGPSDDAAPDSISSGAAAGQPAPGTTTAGPSDEAAPDSISLGAAAGQPAPGTGFISHPQQETCPRCGNPSGRFSATQMPDRSHRFPFFSQWERERLSRLWARRRFR